MNLFSKLKELFGYKFDYNNDNDVDFENDGAPIIHSEPNFIPKYKVNNILDAATTKFFPKTGRWYSSCFSRPSEFHMDNLPCHLRDEKWLAQMLRYQQNIYNVNFEQILEYVRTSDFFDKRRQTYEKRIVKWQINYMINGGEGWIVDSMYGGDFSTMEDKCESQFRKGVITTLTTIGLDREVIKICLEEYSNIWLNKMINTSFENTYEYTHTFPTISDNVIYLNSYEMHKSEPLFRESWIKLRRYDYYQEHKKYVDMVNGMRDVANLSNDEISKLRDFVEFKSRSRKQTINAFKDYMYECDKILVLGFDNPLGNMYVEKKESSLTKKLTPSKKVENK